MPFLRAVVLGLAYNKKTRLPSRVFCHSRLSGRTGWSVDIQCQTWQGLLLAGQASFQPLFTYLCAMRRKVGLLSGLQGLYEILFCQNPILQG